MTKKPTIKELAAAAGVSVGTASRVINNHSNVGEDVRRRVTDAIERLGFTPDSAAQSMRGGATRSIGIIIRDITVPALASFTRAAQDTLHEAGYVLLILCSTDSKEREMELLEVLRKRRVDGLIMATSSERDPEILEACRRLNLPILLLDRSYPEEWDAVLVDHDAGIGEAMDHLLSLGHRRIGLMTGRPVVHPSIARINAYRTKLAEAGIEYDSALVRTGGFDLDSSFFEASALLSSQNRPTALIAGGIDMLGGAIRAIRAAKLSVPHDISLIGSADTELAAFSTPPTNVIRHDAAEQGRLSAQLILNRLAGRSGPDPHRLTISSQYVMRGSCAPPAVRGLPVPASGRARRGRIENSRTPG
ncbi:MAG: LacI family DNA-binding transcriptional regulator [Novosphingobium sp.]